MPTPRENESREDFIGRCMSDEESKRDFLSQDQRFAFCNSRFDQMQKASGAKPLYVRRPLLNAEEVIEWAKSSGFETTLLPDDMHATVVFSKTPFLWYTVEPQQDTLTVRSGLREVMPLGDKGAVVLKFDSPDLTARWAEFRRKGASWDFVSYSPHITITYSGGGVDVNDVAPFDGDLVFGPEIFEELDEGFADRITEKALPSSSSVHVPSTVDRDKAEDSFTPPKGAQDNAKKVLRWREEHPDEIRGMTGVGWRRARQIADGEPLSLDTVKMISQFKRHQQNSKVSEENRGKPWTDAGHVAWLGWGGDAAILRWAPKVIREQERTEKKMAKSDDGLLAIIRELRDMLMGSPTREAESSEPVEMTKDAHYDISGTILKVDDEQRIVYGWASVISENGESIVDTQGDVISSEELTKAVNDFMMEDRVGKVMHSGDRTGTIVHSFPITKDIAKALGIDTNREGWLVGYHVGDDEVWKRVKAGEFTGFSIGGEAKRIPFDE